MRQHVVVRQIVAPGHHQQVPLFFLDVDQGLTVGQVPADRVEIVPRGRVIDGKREIAAAAAGAVIAQALAWRELFAARPRFFWTGIGSSPGFSFCVPEGYTMNPQAEQPPPGRVARPCRSSRRSAGHFGRARPARQPPGRAGVMECLRRYPGPAPGLTSRGTVANGPRALSANANAAAAPGWQLSPRTAAPRHRQAPRGRLGRVRPLPETDEDGNDPAGAAMRTSSSTGFDFGETKGLEQQRVNTLVHQDRPPARRRHPGAPRRSGPIEPSTNRFTARGVPGQLDGAAVDRADARYLAESCQPASIGAEGVGERSHKCRWRRRGGGSRRPHPGGSSTRSPGRRS